MDEEISILAVSEDTCFRRCLLAQHGQSLLINYLGKKILFDVGDFPEAFLHNMKALGENFSDIDTVVISHRHGDHAGALRGLHEEFKDKDVYIVDDFGKPHLRDKDQKYMQANRLEISAGKINIALLEQDYQKVKGLYQNLHIQNDPTKLFEGVYLTGIIGEDIREQAIALEIPNKGFVLVLGCTHPSLELFIHKAQSVVQNPHVYGIIGGLHLKDMDPSQLDKTIEMFKNLDFSFIVPSHCTGAEAIAKLKQTFKDKVFVSSTGTLGTGNSVTLYPDLKFHFV